MSPTYQTALSLKKVSIICLFLCVYVVDGGHFPKSKPQCDLENGVKVNKI